MKKAAFLVFVVLVVMAVPPEVTVDCDAGDDLARALKKAKRFPGTTIRVSGTCTGTFTVAAPDVKLLGDPAGSTVLEGPADAIAQRWTVLDVTVDRFTMRHVTVRNGWIGAHLRGGISTNSTTQIIGSRFEDNYGGVLIDSGSFARVETSVFQSNQVGVTVLFNSQGSIADCDIRDSGVLGIDVYHDSIAGVQNTSVTGSGGIGMAVNIGSYLGVNDSSLADNDGVHFLVQDRSKLQLRNATLGSDSDETELAMFVDDSSLLRSFRTESWGDLFATGAVHLESDDDAFHGSIVMEDFTQANLSRTNVDGGIECRSGSDAFCSTGVTATVSGCASAGAPCAATAASAQPRIEPATPTAPDAPRNLLRAPRSR
jgi:hypothetical protein